jgi:hypothetical protein
VYRVHIKALESEKKLYNCLRHVPRWQTQKRTSEVEEKEKIIEEKAYIVTYTMID